MEKQRFYIGNLSDPIEIDGLKEFLTSEIQPRNPGETFSVDEVQIMRDSSNNCRGFGFVTISHTDSSNNEAFWGMLTKNNKPDASNPITYNGKVLRFELAMQNWKDKLSAEKAQEAKIIEKKQKLAEAYKKLLDPAEAPADATPQVSKIRAPNNKLIDASACCGKRKTFDDIDDDENVEEKEEKEEKEEEEETVKSDNTVKKEEKEDIVEKEEEKEKNEEVENQPPPKKVKKDDKSDEDKMNVEMSAKEAWKKKKEEKKKRIEEERAKKIEEGRAAVRKTGNLLDIYAEPTSKWTFTKKKEEQEEEVEVEENEIENNENENEIKNEGEEEEEEEGKEKEGEKEDKINGVKVLTRKERIKKREKTKKKHLKQKEKRKQRREEREKGKMAAPSQNAPEAKKPEEVGNAEPHKYSITTNVSWSELMKGSKGGDANDSKYVTSYFGGSAASSSFSFLENGATLGPMSKEAKGINIIDTRDLDKKTQPADDSSKKKENVEAPKAKKEPTSLDELIKE